MATLNARVFLAIKAAGVQITGLALGDFTNKATWLVQPPNLQSAAQATIDAFNPDDPAHAIADADAQTDILLSSLDNDLLTAVAEELKKQFDISTPGAFKPAEFKRNVVNRCKHLRRNK